MHTRIYLDNNASTPLDPRVAEEIRQKVSDLQGNPSSTHAFGKKTRSLITKGRDTIAAALKVKPSEVIFTSGGTEGINMLVRGLAAQKEKGHIITSSAEHSCVLASCKLLEASGVKLTVLSPGTAGAVTYEQVKEAIVPETSLIVLMAVNNETGAKTDIDRIASLAMEKGISLVVDGVSQFGKVKIAPFHPGITAMVFSGHKFHALQGIGFAYVRHGTKISPLLVGGEQEYGKRAGTENLLGIASMAKAVECFAERQEEYVEHILMLRDRFEGRLLSSLKDVYVNGDGERTSNVSNLAFMGVDGETLLMMLDQQGVAASHGSACSSGALEPSRVLAAMGLPLARVTSSIRFSFSRMNTVEEVDRACAIIETIVKKLSH